jgi:hypothetical protein
VACSRPSVPLRERVLRRSGAAARECSGCLEDALLLPCVFEYGGEVHRTSLCLICRMWWAGEDGIRLATSARLAQGLQPLGTVG